jgi:hypothetical protein
VSAGDSSERPRDSYARERTTFRPSSRGRRARRAAARTQRARRPAGDLANAGQVAGHQLGRRAVRSRRRISRPAIRSTVRR